MSNVLKLSGFMFALLVILLGGVQLKLVSPRLFGLVATTTTLSTPNNWYDGMPSKSFDWY